LLSALRAESGLPLPDGIATDAQTETSSNVVAENQV